MLVVNYKTVPLKQQSPLCQVGCNVPSCNFTIKFVADAFELKIDGDSNADD